MQTKQQAWNQANLQAEITVHVLGDDDDLGYRAKAIITCPGCGYRYYLQTRPDQCLGCDFRFSGQEQVKRERNLDHLLKDKVGRYVQV